MTDRRHTSDSLAGLPPHLLVRLEGPVPPVEPDRDDEQENPEADPAEADPRAPVVVQMLVMYLLSRLQGLRASGTREVEQDEHAPQAAAALETVRLAEDRGNVLLYRSQ